MVTLHQCKNEGKLYGIRDASMHRAYILKYKLVLRHSLLEMQARLCINFIENDNHIILDECERAAFVNGYIEGWNHE